MTVYKEFGAEGDLGGPAIAFAVVLGTCHTAPVDRSSLRQEERREEIRSNCFPYVCPLPLRFALRLQTKRLYAPAAKEIHASVN